MILIVRMKMNKTAKVDDKETEPALPNKKAEPLKIETANKPEPALQPTSQDTPQQITGDTPAPQPVESFPPAKSPVEPQPAPANKPVQGESGLDDIFSGKASSDDDLFK